MRLTDRIAAEGSFFSRNILLTSSLKRRKLFMRHNEFLRPAIEKNRDLMLGRWARICHVTLPRTPSSNPLSSGSTTSTEASSRLTHDLDLCPFSRKLFRSAFT